MCTTLRQNCITKGWDMLHICCVNCVGQEGQGIDATKYHGFYRELLLNSHKIHGNCPEQRKVLLEARYYVSPLSFFHIMKLKEHKLAFRTHCICMYHRWWTGTSHEVLSILCQKLKQCYSEIKYVAYNHHSAHTLRIFATVRSILVKGVT